ncbi:MAG: EexN family lipoprotein [Moraxella sp.]|nr:EexN family lipoprotein [Moraxella sp.]
MKLNTLMITVIAVFLVGCGGKEYTVDFLKENNEVRAKVLEDCKANKESDTNCKNANEAQKFIDDKASADFFMGKSDK